MFFTRLRGYQGKRTGNSLKISGAWLLIALFVFGLALKWQRFPISAKSEPSVVTKRPDTIPSPANPVTVSAAETRRVNETYAKLPLAFEENQGQAPVSARYTVRGAGYSLAFSSTEATLMLGGASSPQKAVQAGDKNIAPARVIEKQEKLTLNFIGANVKTAPTGIEELPERSNYFFGNDSSKWHKDVRNYSKIKYAEVYPGIDAVFYGNQRSLEYDFIVAPGSDPNKIELEYKGHRNLKITKGGDLVVSLDARQLKQSQPVAYQEVNGERRAVECRYILTNKANIHCRCRCV
jgi:hypothetical protein